MPIVGPNSIGLVNTRLGAGMLFIPSFAQMKLIDGPVSSFPRAVASATR